MLTGQRFLKRRKYPTHISSTLEDALGWMLPRLDGGTARVAQLQEAGDHIHSQRASGSYAHLL